ncbi:hypothetical protein CPB84DRAFT_1752428 [Gymnopilus junonius]|uniref:Uncharacterized protein n=1 Tax=Gymnopilus junonius TaxID=109634 RepID=A0A9P5NCW3_GYMJU|nr:hypothetical protein CPB84DRAFT_1752428 [Gymnopilus junonius]
MSAPASQLRLTFRILASHYYRLPKRDFEILQATVSRQACDVREALDRAGRIGKAVIIMTRLKYSPSGTDAKPHYTGRVFYGKKYTGGIHLYEPGIYNTPAVFVSVEKERHKKWKKVPFQDALNRSVDLF